MPGGDCCKFPPYSTFFLHFFDIFWKFPLLIPLGISISIPFWEHIIFMKQVAFYVVFEVQVLQKTPKNMIFVLLHFEVHFLKHKNTLRLKRMKIFKLPWTMAFSLQFCQRPPLPIPPDLMLGTGANVVADPLVLFVQARKACCIQSLCKWSLSWFWSGLCPCVLWLQPFSQAVLPASDAQPLRASPFCGVCGKSGGRRGVPSKVYLPAFPLLRVGSEFFCAFWWSCVQGQKFCTDQEGCFFFGFSRLGKLFLTKRCGGWGWVGSHDRWYGMASTSELLPSKERPHQANLVETSSFLAHTHTLSVTWISLDPNCNSLRLFRHTRGLCRWTQNYL